MVPLDVVIVNWNAGEQILDCLKSLQAASRGSDLIKLSSCVIVDNASTDRSLDSLPALGIPLTIIKNADNKGFGSACNQGSKIGNSKYILFLNPDVRLSPDSLEKTVSFMEEPRNQKVAATGIQFVFDGKIQRTTARFPTRTSFFYQMLGLDRLWPGRFPPLLMTDWDHEESRELDHVPASFLLIRRKIFEELQGFNEQFFMYYEDLDLSFRIKKAGWKIYYLATVQSFHRGGGTSYQVRAERLYYVLCSRVYYVAKHFGYWTAVGIMVASVLAEFWVRLGWSLIKLSRRAFTETIETYGRFVWAFPRLLKELKNR